MSLAPGPVEEVRAAVLAEVAPEESTDRLMVCREGGQEALEDDEEVGDGEALTAILMREEQQGRHAFSTKVVTDSNLWIVTGNNWNFRILELEANKEETVKIKASSFLKQEHKFAIFYKPAHDAKRWRAERYRLEHKGATLKVQGGRVSVEYQGELGDAREVPLTPDGQVKEFDMDEKAMRMALVPIIISIVAILLAPIGI